MPQDLVLIGAFLILDMGSPFGVRLWCPKSLQEASAASVPLCLPGLGASAPLSSCAVHPTGSAFFIGLKCSREGLVSFSDASKCLSG